MKRQHQAAQPARRLPTDPRERVAFCFAFGDHFDGENFDESLRFAWFAVHYQKALGIGPWAEGAA